MGVWDTVSNFISNQTSGFGGGNLDWFYASQNAVINQANKATYTGLASIESTINSTAGGVVNSVKGIVGKVSTELQEDYMNLYNGQVKLNNQVNSITGSLNDAITGASEKVIRGVDDVIGDTVRGVVTGVTDKALQTLRANMMLDMGTQFREPIMGQLGLQSKNQTAVLTEQIRDNFTLGTKQLIDATGSTMEGISQDLMTNLDSTMKAYSEHLEKSWASELATLQKSGLLDNQLMDELNPYLEQGMAVALGSAQTAEAIGQRTLAQVSSLADAVTKYLPLLIVGVGFLMVM
jgi:hypothetical protein